MVTELLAEADYAAGFFVGHKGMHSRGKLDRGFEVVSDREIVRGDKNEPIREGRNPRRWPWIG